jgi:hypothetical protein
MTSSIKDRLKGIIHQEFQRDHPIDRTIKNCLHDEYKKIVSRIRSSQDLLQDEREFALNCFNKILDVYPMHLEGNPSQENSHLDEIPLNDYSNLLHTISRLQDYNYSERTNSWTYSKNI